MGQDPSREDWEENMLKRWKEFMGMDSSSSRSSGGPQVRSGVEHCKLSPMRMHPVAAMLRYVPASGFG